MSHLATEKSWHDNQSYGALPGGFVLENSTEKTPKNIYFKGKETSLTVREVQNNDKFIKIEPYFSFMWQTTIRNPGLIRQLQGIGSSDFLPLATLLFSTYTFYFMA